MEIIIVGLELLKAENYDLCLESELIGIDPFCPEYIARFCIPER